MAWQDLPPHLLYPLIMPHVAWLCIKYRASPAMITRANPLFPCGGLPFAPKDQMFKHFERTLPYILLRKEDALDARMKQADAFVNYPAILKPNLAHRGVDVNLVRNRTELEQKLTTQEWDYLLQEYNDDEYEFGVFYVRKPGEQGRIVSITQKTIPLLVGNGQDTIETLIDNSDIENKQAIKEAHAHQLKHVLNKEERLKTLVCAAHSRGAMFYDRKDLITPELEKSVDAICNKPGFHFGRLDVKTKSIQAFQQGDFSIIEVNGCTSEFVHIYDNTYTLRQGIADLKTQWNLLFEIAHANREQANPVGMIEFIRGYLTLFKQTKQIIGKPW